MTNARIGSVIGTVVKNAIPINGLKNTSPNAVGTYAMVSFCNDSQNREFIAVVVVEPQSRAIDSFELFDVAHAVSGRQKNSSQVDTKSQGVNPIKATTISIADLLNIVNSTHQSILSDNVLSHLGEIRAENGSFSDKVLFSDRVTSDEEKQYLELAKHPEKNKARLMPPEGVYLRSERLLFSDRDGDIKDATQLTESDLRYLLEQIQTGELDTGYIPVARTTPQFYIDVVNEHSKGKTEVMKVPLASSVEHMIQNMEESDGTTYEDGKTPHRFSIDDIIKISKEMIHPKYIVLQRNGRYAEVVSFFSEKRKKQVVLFIDFAEEGETPKNFKYEQYMNGYNGGYYNIIVTEYEPTDLKSYLKNNEIVYDRQRMNGKYQVGSGRIVTVTHDTPFIQKDNTTAESKSQGVSDKKLDSERDTSLDPRTLLTNALENAAVTEDEKNFLKAYKDQIDILNKQTKRLAEIKAGKELSKKKGTAEERTEKANEASLMPPEGVYLYAERDFVTDDEVAKTGRSAAKAPRRNEMHTLFEITVEQNRDISRLNRYDDNYRGKFTGGKQYIYSTFRNKHILKRNPKY